MAVSKRTRFEVFRRDDYTCRYCRATDNPLTIDHVAARVALAARSVDNRFRYFRGVANNMLADLQRDATAILVAEDRPAPRSGKGDEFWSGYRLGGIDCSIGDHPDHYQAMALSRVVDAPAHEWASTWPYPSELYPIYRRT